MTHQTREREREKGKGRDQNWVRLQISRRNIYNSFITPHYIASQFRGQMSKCCCISFCKIEMEPSQKPGKNK